MSALKDAWVGSCRSPRRRAPTSAQHRDPAECGPAGDRARLPPSPCPRPSTDRRDPSGRRAPAYSFGLRLEGPKESRSPGPQYLVPPGFTARGRLGGPAFTMSGRPRERRESNTPGPAHYSLERADRLTLPSAPACSVRSRGRSDRPPQTPGPASYHLPPVVGSRLVNKTSAPEYTMTGRKSSIFEDKKKTPGPNKYSAVDTNVYMARAPRCTLTGRSRPLPTSNTPGPSHYHPKQSSKQGQSFGVRHAECVIPVMDSPL